MLYQLSYFSKLKTGLEPATSRLTVEVTPALATTLEMPVGIEPTYNSFANCPHYRSGTASGPTEIRV